MPRHLFLVFTLFVCVRLHTQQPTPESVPPTDPKALLSAAAKAYDFTSAELSPWHLKATYQLYDVNGVPAQNGTLEYWWASPRVHRSAWTRPGMERTEWTTEDGATYRRQTGEPLKHFERILEQSLISPLPAKKLMEPGRRLDMRTISAGSGHISCMTSTPQSMAQGKLQAPHPPIAGYYCFDPHTQALRLTYFNSVTTDYSRVASFQGRFLARDMSISVGKITVFSVSVETLEALDSTNAELNPPPDAERVSDAVRGPAADSGGSITIGSLVKKTQPVYPSEAKASLIQGTVVLAAIIGKDGKIKDLEALASPSEVLTKSALDSVRKWEYKPYLLNGAPVEVDTVVNVIYAFGQ
jgi:TonB family protein